MRNNESENQHINQKEGQSHRFVNTKNLGVVRQPAPTKLPSRKQWCLFGHQSKAYILTLNNRFACDKYPRPINQALAARSKKGKGLGSSSPKISLAPRMSRPAAILQYLRLLTSRPITDGSFSFVVSYDNFLVTPDDKVLKLDCRRLDNHTEETYVESR